MSENLQINKNRQGPLRYAIIGTGMMGHEHLQNLALVRQLAGMDLQVTALIDPDAPMLESALKLAKALGNEAAQAYRTLSDAPLDDIDAFVIVSESGNAPKRRYRESQKPCCAQRM